MTGLANAALMASKAARIEEGDNFSEISTESYSRELSKQDQDEIDSKMYIFWFLLITNFKGSIHCFKP